MRRLLPYISKDVRGVIEPILDYIITVESAVRALPHADGCKAFVLYDRDDRIHALDESRCDCPKRVVEAAP